MRGQGGQEAPDKVLVPQDVEGEKDNAPRDFLKEEVIELDDQEEGSTGSETELTEEPEPSSPGDEKSDKETDTKDIDDVLEEIKEEIQQRDDISEENITPGPSLAHLSREGGESEAKGITTEAKKKRKWKGIKKFLLYGVGIFILGIVSVLAAKAYIWKEVEVRSERKMVLKPIQRLVLEERLDPFFVPLPEKGAKDKAPRVMAYIEIMARWEKIVSIQFKENRAKIRADLYWVLLKFMKEDNNPSAMKTNMEKALTAAAKKTLGVSDVEMRIERIKII